MTRAKAIEILRESIVDAGGFSYFHAGSALNVTQDNLCILGELERRFNYDHDYRKAATYQHRDKIASKLGIDKELLVTLEAIWERWNVSKIKGWGEVFDADPDERRMMALFEVECALS